MKNETLKKYPYITLNSYNAEIVDVINFESTSLVWISKSECKCTINFKLETILSNTLLFFNKGEMFSCENKRFTQIEVLKFNPEIFSAASTLVSSLFNSLLQNNNENYTAITFDTEQVLFIENTFKDILLCLKTVPNANTEELKTSLNNLILECLNVKLNKDYNYLIQFVNILNNQYKINHNVSNYADQLDIAQKIYYEIFRSLDLKSPALL